MSWIERINSSATVCFSDLILFELSSASESIQPGLINFGLSILEFDFCS